MIHGVDHSNDLVADSNGVRNFNGRAHQQRHALGDRALAVARCTEDEQRRARHHGAADLIDDVLLELEGAESLLERCVGDVGLARRLRANQCQVVVEVDRARAEVSRLHRRHLGRALPAGAGDGVPARWKSPVCP